MAGGRPRKEIDYETAYKLAKIFCTQEEIASVLNLSVRKLQMDEEFMRVYKQGQEHAKISVRRAQFKSATLNGSVPMLIWLGKQYLHQREKPEDSDGIEKIADALKDFLDNVQK